MTGSSILQSTMLDIVFEKRNKNYAAYTLRKFYYRRLIAALFCTAGIAALLALFAVYDRGALSNNISTLMPLENAYVNIKEVHLPKPKIPKPSVAKQVTPQKKLKTMQFLSNIKIERNEKLVAALGKTLDSFVINSKTAKGDTGPTLQMIVPAEVSHGAASGMEIPKPPSVDKGPLNVADVMPQFPGGNQALHRFLQKNLQNPQTLEAGEKRSVKVQFVVDYNGQIKMFTVIQDGGAAFNNEVLRVLKKMPAWIPGKSDGKNVAVYFTVPVQFETED